MASGTCSAKAQVGGANAQQRQGEDIWGPNALVSSPSSLVLEQHLQGMVMLRQHHPRHLFNPSWHQRFCPHLCDFAPRPQYFSLPPQLQHPGPLLRLSDDILARLGDHFVIIWNFRFLSSLPIEVNRFPPLDSIVPL